MASGLPSLPNDAIASYHFAVEIDGVEIASSRRSAASTSRDRRDRAQGEHAGRQADDPEAARRAQAADDHPASAAKNSTTRRSGTGTRRCSQGKIADGPQERLDHPQRLRGRRGRAATTSPTAGLEGARSAPSRPASTEVLMEEVIIVAKSSSESDVRARSTASARRPVRTPDRRARAMRRCGPSSRSCCRAASSTSGHRPPRRRHAPGDGPGRDPARCGIRGCARTRRT